MSNRPEGLSPCYFSLASPDIPASHYFKWTWAGQTSATIRIYTASKTLLKSYNVSGSTQSVSLGSVGYAFENGTTYYWTVQAQNSQLSVYAKFKYDAAPQTPGITWNALAPKKGETVKKTSRFDEIKDNLLTLLDNYTGVPGSLRTTVDSLFIGSIVPSKRDFRNLQTVIQFIGQKEGITYKTSTTTSGATKYEVILSPTPARNYDTTDPVFSPFAEEFNPEIAPGALDVVSWVSDSLGVSDIEKVVQYINYLTTIAPKPIKELSFSVPSTSMYEVFNVASASAGVEDKTIDVSWSVEDINNTHAKVLFKNLSPSTDLWFYDCEFAYGPNGQFKSRVFMRPEDVTDVSGVDERLFETNWNGLFNTATIGQALLQFDMAAVDHYGNISPVRGVSKTFGSNFKVPIGVQSYQLEVQRTDIGATSYSVGGTWYPKYSGSRSATTYTLSGGEGKLWHRVKAIDKSGLESVWAYETSSVLFDPLQPPGKVSNFRADNIGLSQVGLYWSPTPTATEYQIYKWLTPGTEVMRGTGSGNSTTRGTWATGLSPNTSYNFYIRAGNAKGWGPWASISTKTKDYPVIEKIWKSVHSHSWSDKYGWMADQGVGHTHIYQGQWNGQTGNYKGLWYFDYDSIRSAISGKEIVGIWIECTRIRAGYSTANAARFWTHNRNRDSWYYNHNAGPGSLSGGSLNSSYLFSIDEKQWVPLPTSYAEWIRDGKATGIAIHEPDGNPYLKFDNNARIKIKYK